MSSPLTASANKILHRSEVDLCDFIDKEVKNSLKAYKRQPNFITEHANDEQVTVRSRYTNRQLFELVQNGADALVKKDGGGKIVVRLTEKYLYCADSGNPITKEGISALMFSRMSDKTDPREIGRFGLGFKSVLEISDSPEFFSESVSFNFDRKCAEKLLKPIAPNLRRYPVLRLPKCIDPWKKISEDCILEDLSSWASNIIRLRLLPGSAESIEAQMDEFTAEFLLFANHVRLLQFENSLSDSKTTYTLTKSDGSYDLAENKIAKKWKLFEREHRLSEKALNDRQTLDTNETVLIQWAVPLDRLQEPGEFWKFFPTIESSLVAGILNCHWNTTEDRQNLHHQHSPYNEELIRVAADLVSNNLQELSTSKDPSCHLDVLPRRWERGDLKLDLVNLLRNELFSKVSKKAVVPNQNGILCKLEELRYIPKEITEDRHVYRECIEKWSSCIEKPIDWLHKDAYTRNRLSTIDRLFNHKGSENGAPRKSIREWLESLVTEVRVDYQVEASKIAIQTAALMPSDIRAVQPLGNIVLTATGKLRRPDSSLVFLREEDGANEESNFEQSLYVHSELEADEETKSALKKLGIRSPSLIVQLELIIDQLLSSRTSDEILSKFWKLSRKLDPKQVIATVNSRMNNSDPQRLEQERKRLISKNFLVFTRSNEWKQRHSVLLPGEIVPGDGTRDDSNSVDLEFHCDDLELLRLFNCVSTPCDNHVVSDEPWFSLYLKEKREELKKIIRTNLGKNARDSLLNFSDTSCSGPLEVLKHLSPEGQAIYTDFLLRLESTYEQWRMRHISYDSYPELVCDSPAINIVRMFGKIRTPGEIVPFTDALGEHPISVDALNTLLKHPQANNIKTVFQLIEPAPEIVGEEESVPLIDVWPGLKGKLTSEVQLIRCQYIRVLGEHKKCLFYESNVYLVPVEQELHELRLINEQLNLGLSEEDLEDILAFRIREEIERRRIAIQDCATDSDRLLLAVGEEILRSQLPSLLLQYLEYGKSSLSGIELADMVIATYHTDALKRCKDGLVHLEPPVNWNGSPQAIKFVVSLGFSAEWAGDRIKKRAPYIEVVGPSPLPPLHSYQRIILKNIINFLEGEDATRRGLISLPTGSGKTRVTVQAVIEAIRSSKFTGGVIWVADRDEICEQAVEAWHQVWSIIGTKGVRLRISRVWGGQPEPAPHGNNHVVVASIQTLYSKLNNPQTRRKYEFLRNFALVIFDEAHRSIAKTYTSALEELGLTRFKKASEPYLIGLTATPYRGHNEVETRRLVRRYGNNRLDREAFSDDDPSVVIRDLQTLGILAEADHKEIKGEFISENMFTASEWSSAQEQIRNQPHHPWLPRIIETKIAKSVERTNRIISNYIELVPSDWPTLIFATSVEHSETIAALLNSKGIVARSVSAYTPTAIRRKIVEEYRGGKIRVLVNYGIFTEGFDAPSTRAIVVARPVYSPNLYFQMIGRGLRGVKNGGNETCLILNVIDNVQNFDRELAFAELEWLWRN